MNQLCGTASHDMTMVATVEANMKAQAVVTELATFWVEVVTLAPV